MDGNGCRQPLQIIAAFQNGHNAALRMGIRRAHEFQRRPGEILFAQLQAAQGIGGQRAMSIFSNILAKATRAQDDPLNLAYIPAAPTRAAVAFDAASANAASPWPMPLARSFATSSGRLIV